MSEVTPSLATFAFAPGDVVMHRAYEVEPPRLPVRLFVLARFQDQSIDGGRCNAYRCRVANDHDCEAVATFWEPELVPYQPSAIGLQRQILRNASVALDALTGTPETVAAP